MEICEQVSQVQAEILEDMSEGETQTLQEFTQSILEKLEMESITPEFFNWSVNGKLIRDSEFKISKDDDILIIPIISGGK